jgi:predicted nucleic acid-binding protein
MNRVFLDTNFFVYASDDGTPAKRDHAKKVGSELLDSTDVPVISTHVLQEYFIILTRKLRLSSSDAKEKLLLLGDVEVELLSPS